ncbi:hypothetical protein QWZ10_25630 [Paracoccus cavernae]|uniref:Uncharacterized protein n=1 Tax=Paracoccus cavernae TaxID=1571207 RepID=A0ABT8DD48_9RHOB|nr:hypothetical protein [Paracoccus cavernae]
MSGPLPAPPDGKSNPAVYFAPVSVDGIGTCICFVCAEARGWLDRAGEALMMGWVAPPDGTCVP